MSDLSDNDIDTMDEESDLGVGYEEDDSMDEGFADEYDDDEDISVSPIEPKGKGRMDFGEPWDVSYKVLSSEDIKKQQQKEIDQVSSITGASDMESARLLRYYQWNKDRLLERFMEDPDKVFRDAGVQVEGSSSQQRVRTETDFTCGVCFEDYDKVETVALACEHRFCKECYSTYLTSKVLSEGESRDIQCMQEKCKLVVDERTVSAVVEPAVAQKYHDLLGRTYVEDNQYLRFCPAPNCEYVVECQIVATSLDTTVPTVKCRCGHSFCFWCGLDNHQPCICSIVKKWLKKCQDDSETANWISANTKECPKCHSTIEKNGGCNHMTCKKCHYEFCWVCMGEWSLHGTSYYNCSRYQEKDVEAIKDAQSKSRLTLERYLHYYNRFANHEQSAKLEKEVYTRIEEKMEAMQNSSDLSWIEVQFLKKAVDVLHECREVLKWTYAMAFYMARTNHTEMFEDNQRDLENAVEQLSELLEKPIDTVDIEDLRRDTTDKTVYVQKRNRILLEDALRGYGEDRWQWSIPLEKP